MIKQLAWVSLFSCVVSFASAGELIEVVQGVRVAPELAVLSNYTPILHSSIALVKNADTGEVLYQKNAGTVTPIASVTKLMTAMVVLDSNLPLDETLDITTAEIDRLKGTRSRLKIGSELSRRQMLLLALMSSENRAAAALARHYPGGTEAFLERMNRKARSLGMSHTVFYDVTGLDKRNSSTAEDLSRLIASAIHYPLIREFSTRPNDVVFVGDKVLKYRNTNILVREGKWSIDISKTGYIRESGRCLVMHATVKEQPLLIVLLSSDNTMNRTSDARALRSWLEPTISSLI